MADTKLSGSRRTAQHPPEVRSSETSPPPSKHVRVLEVAANLNRGLDQVLADVVRLHQLGSFRSDLARRSVETCRLTIEEMRAWVTFEVTADLSLRAEKDWDRYAQDLYKRLQQKFQRLAAEQAAEKKTRGGKVRERAL